MTWRKLRPRRQLTLKELKRSGRILIRLRQDRNTKVLKDLSLREFGRLDGVIRIGNSRARS